MRPVVGVDLGGSNLRVALVDVADDGKIRDERRESVSVRDPEAVADRIVALAHQLDPDAAHRGVGVGIAAMLRGWTGVVGNAPNLGWREVDFRAMLRARLGDRVELYNDVNAIAYGETVYGAARGARDVLAVFVGTGVGGGLVTDGILYIGGSHVAGEIGHVKVVPGGRLCGCGARGCIEAYASGRHLAERAREELRDQPRSLPVVLAGSLAALHAGHLDEAARRGDAWACALWAEVAPLLGSVLANAVTLLNPTRLVLGGTVWEGCPDLRRRAVEAYRAAVNAPAGEAATLVDAALGDNAGVLGAAALVAAGVIK